MKKICFVLLLVICSAFTIKAQGTLMKGERQLNAGLGLSQWGVPLYVGVDFGLPKDFSLGIEASIRSFSDNWNQANYTHTIIGFGGNGNYHFNRVLKLDSEWDFYAGLNIGFYIWSSPSGYNGSHFSGLGVGGQFGGRYFITKRFGLNVELGGGNAFSGGKFGISYKF